MEKTNFNQENQIRKQILELGPLILFFIGNYFFGILWGTGILVVSTLVSISASWVLDKKIPLMALFGCIAVVFFGLLTLIFDRDVALQNTNDIGVFLFIIISLFVGLFNLLPIPLLDGGHIMYFIIRRIFSNSLPEFITRVYLAVGITIISFLFIVVTYNDIFYK